MPSSDLCRRQAPKCSTDMQAGKIYVHMKKKKQIIDSKTNTQNAVTKNVWLAYTTKKEVLLGLVFIIAIIRIAF